MFRKTKVCSGLMLAFGGSLALGSLPALAQDAAQRVEITGSSIKRIDAETALPVTVIKREDIDKSGVTTAGELLDRVSANNGQGYFQSAGIGFSDRPGFNAASLRGIGFYNTLVLLNGRRVANYAFDSGAVDLNSIPFAAIERVEILRDGASAIYGTDAIGGVINFITRKDFRGGDVTARVDRTTQGGAAANQGSVVLGFGDLSKDRFNVFGALSFTHEDSLKASERTFSRSAYRPDIGPQMNRLSSNAFPGNVFDPNSGAFVSPAAPGCQPPVSVSLGSTRCRFDYASVIDTLPPSDRANLIARGTFQLNQDNEVFAEYTRTKNKFTFRISPTPISEAVTFNGDPLLYPAGGKYHPGVIQGIDFTGQDLDVYYRAVDAGPRTDVARATQDRIVVGAQGAVFGWDYKTGVTHSTSRATDAYTDGWVRESVFLPNFATGNINPFGPNDAAGLALVQEAKINQIVRTAKGTTDSIDLTGSRDVMQLPAGPLSIAVGAEYRREKLDDVLDPIFSSGDILGGGGNQQSRSGSRNVSALFTELNVPVVKGLEAQLALRHDKYSDFGSTTNPKIAFRWQPASAFLVRGSASSGFRAPTLADLYSGQVKTNTGGAYNDPLRCGPGLPNLPTDCGGNNSLQQDILQGGNPNLKPEKSKQWSLGFVVEPTRSFSLGIDYWVINRKDLIGNASEGTIIDKFLANPLDPSVVVRKPAAPGSTVPGPINYFLQPTTNIGETQTSGIDLSAKFNAGATPLGELKIGHELTYLRKFNYRELSSDPWTTQVGVFSTFGPIARVKSTTSFDLTTGPWAFALIYNYRSGYEDYNTDLNGNPVAAQYQRRVGSYETFDAQTAYTGLKNLKLTLGIKNLLNRNPPDSNQLYYFQIGYDPSDTDPRGRTIYLAANYKF